MDGIIILKMQNPIAEKSLNCEFYPVQNEKRSLLIDYIFKNLKINTDQLYVCKLKDMNTGFFCYKKIGSTNTSYNFLDFKGITEIRYKDEKYEMISNDKLFKDF
jgi:hypothetical protein